MTWPTRPTRPSWPRRQTFVDNAAAHLAWRRTARYGVGALLGWMLAVSAASVVASRWWEGLWVVALVLVPVASLFAGITWRHVRAWAREPIPRTFAPPPPHGVTTDAETATSTLVPAAGAFLLVYAAAPGEASTLAAAGLAALAWVVFAATTLWPGVLFRRRRHEYLARTLATDPVAAAAWAEIRRTYPADAPYPFE